MSTPLHVPTALDAPAPSPDPSPIAVHRWDKLTKTLTLPDGTRLDLTAGRSSITLTDTASLRRPPLRRDSPHCQAWLQPNRSRRASI
jgi:hypothetical protein